MPTPENELEWRKLFGEFVPNQPEALRQTLVQHGEAPVKDDYTWYSDLTREYSEKPVSIEDQEKRARAASAVQGIGALGNAFSAIGNMFGVGAYAPSQKIPDLYDANKDINEYKDRATKARELYLRNAMQGHQLDGQEYDKAYGQWMQAVGADNAARKAEHDAGVQERNAYLNQYNVEANRQMQKDENDWGHKQAEQDRKDKNSQFWANYNLNKEYKAGQQRINALRALGGNGDVTGAADSVRMFVPQADGSVNMEYPNVRMKALLSNPTICDQLIRAYLDDKSLEAYETEWRRSEKDGKKVRTLQEKVLSKVLSEESSGELYKALDAAGYIDKGQPSQGGNQIKINYGNGTKEEEGGDFFDS